MKKIISVIAALCMIFALCACGSPAAPADAPAAPVGAAEAAPASVSADLTVGTGGESGTYYLYTGMVGQVVGDNTGIKMTVVATGGSKDNLVSMDAGMYDLATVQSDVMTYAYNGTNSFADSGALTDFRVLMALYPETIQIVTTDPGIKSIEDLKGRKVCVGDVGSGTYFNTLDILAAYDMTIDDLDAVFQSFGASTESLLDGKIDAAVTTAGAPTPSITQLAESRDIFVLSIDDAHMDKLLAACPWYAKIVLPAGTYKSMAADCTTVTVKATLVCTADTPDEVAYTIVKTIFDNKDAITELHEKGSYIGFDFATDGIAVPYAAGAARYFAENGVTVATAD